MRFIYFDKKHINRSKVHYIEKQKAIVNNETEYRVLLYIDFVDVVDYFRETFGSEEEANKRYYEVLDDLNSD